MTSNTWSVDATMQQEYWLTSTSKRSSCSSSPRSQLNPRLATWVLTVFWKACTTTFSIRRYRLWEARVRRSRPERDLNVNVALDKYRAADGGNNNINSPHIGQAGSYYARSVPPRHVPTNLPDPEVLFDTLLARKGKAKVHPTKISSLLFAFAGIIVHDLFRTSDKDKDVAATSSYLDLSPLYGSTQEAQNSVRTMVDGKLKTDTFAEVRFINQPPHVSQ